MADSDQANEVAPKKRSKKALLLGVALMLVLGAGGFIAVYSGMLLGSNSEAPGDERAAVAALPDIAFVPIDPIIVSLGGRSGSKHLRFSAQLEVAKSHQADVVMLTPRILDVLNGYLRAVEVAMLEDPSALMRLRAQMLRRVQIVTGEGRVRDLLITEFVLN